MCSMGPKSELWGKCEPAKNRSSAVVEEKNMSSAHTTAAQAAKGMAQPESSINMKLLRSATLPAEPAGKADRGSQDLAKGMTCPCLFGSCSFLVWDGLAHTAPVSRAASGVVPPFANLCTRRQRCACGRLDFNGRAHWCRLGVWLEATSSAGTTTPASQQIFCVGPDICLFPGMEQSLPPRHSIAAAPLNGGGPDLFFSVGHVWSTRSSGNLSIALQALLSRLLT